MNKFVEINNESNKTFVNEQDIRNQIITEFTDELKAFIEENMIPKVRTEESYHVLTDLSEQYIDEIAERIIENKKENSLDEDIEY